MKKVFLIIGLVFVALVSTCVYQVFTKGKKVLAAGDTAIAEFHERYNAGKDAEIVEKAAPNFKATVKLEDLQKQMEPMRATLGKFTSASRNSINVSSKNGNTTLEIGCASTFEKGTADESFTFDYNGEAPLLLGYSYKSTTPAPAPAPAAPAPTAPNP